MLYLKFSTLMYEKRFCNLYCTILRCCWHGSCIFASWLLVCCILLDSCFVLNLLSFFLDFCEPIFALTLKMTITCFGLRILKFILFSALFFDLTGQLKNDPDSPTLRPVAVRHAQSTLGLTIPLGDCGPCLGMFVLLSSVSL